MAITAILYLIIVSVIVALINNVKNEKIKNSGINEIDSMNGRDFELFLSHLFKKYGYQTKVTSYQNDYGADLILTKNQKKIAVQAKRWNSKIGIKAVQEVIGAMGYYKTNEAWVITNNEFTEPAISLAKSNNVKLFNRQALIDMIIKTKK